MRPGTLLAVLAFAVAGCDHPRDFSGVVTHVADGDTLTVATPARGSVTVRLGEIDAPEREQAYADRARDALSELTLRRTVTVRYQDTDAYGRTVGRVYAGDVDVSAEMVRRGLAWAYRYYLRDEALSTLEREAREAGRGLWAGPLEPVAPWEWRRGTRPAGIATRERSVPRACGSKRYCREMTSCEEAVFYLEQCNLTTIDGDDDGVPCETICR